MLAPEKIKELLDEFTHSYALIEAEIRLIQEQVEELENRLNLCYARQQTIGLDRDRVRRMQEKHAGVLTNSEALPSPQPIHPLESPQPSQSESIPQEDSETKSNRAETKIGSTRRRGPKGAKPASQNEESAILASPNQIDQTVGNLSNTQNQDSLKQDALIEEAAAELRAQEKLTDLGENQGEEADSDTVKSINDALRSLFSR